MDKIYGLLEMVRPEEKFRDSQDFISDGLLDSFDIISLIEMLEEEYNILIDGMEIIPENFINVQAMEALIVRSPQNK